MRRLFPDQDLTLVNIDLTRHAVVEASAGTGKTYTIEKLVLRLLAEAKAGIQQILVVTYTEKATGELRDRIRTALEEKSKERPETRQIWNRALDEFDQAPIFTIHGFCQRLLREYAVEQGQDFRSELIDDVNLLEPLLHEIQRKQWRQEFGAGLQCVLEEAHFDRNCAAVWERRVRDVATVFRPQRGHRLLPEPIEDIENVFRIKIARLGELAGLPDDAVDHVWIAGFENCAMNARARNNRIDNLIRPLLVWLEHAQQAANLVAAYLALETEIGSRFRTDFPNSGFAVLFHKGAEREEIHALCPGLDEAIIVLEELRQLHRSRADRLAVRTIRWLHEQLAQHKREHGLYSFEDLIVDADTALDPLKPGNFAQTLRDRFRYAIVDEFQDTDPLQWRIFQRVFLEGSHCRLFVVGDPKQAIFRFRGADLPTYSHATREMEAKRSAERYTLKENWRSTPMVLKALNHLFEKGQWFASSPGIVYEEGVPPPLPRNRLDQDRTGRPAVSLVDLKDCERLGDCSRRYARFAAREIRRLIDARLEIVLKNQPKLLDAGDIAALVFRRSEAGPLVHALSEQQIPFTFYKQPGLWESEQAKHFLFILDAIARPADRGAWRKGLMTRFFRLGAKDLTLSEEMPGDHPARRLMKSWMSFADKRNWSALSQSLLEESAIMFEGRNEPEFDRRLSNYRYLLAWFQEWGYRNNLDLSELIDCLKNRRADDPNADVQPIETDRPKVKIMTIHASKGLEFPVVFLAGGLTRGRQGGGFVRYHETGHEIFDLRPDARAKQKAEEEVDADQRRLLYVALTRAMFKAYLPLVRPDQGKSNQRGPACTILGAAILQADLCTLDETAAGCVDPDAFPSIEPSKTSAKSLRVAKQPVAPTEGRPLLPAAPADLDRRRIVMHSFTSLHRLDAYRWQESARFSNSPPRTADEPRDGAEDSLRGPLLGEIVHEVLERIDFGEVAVVETSADLLTREGPRRLLDRAIERQLPKFRTRMPRHALAEECRNLVLSLVWNSLRTPLPGLGAPLCSVSATDRLAELEFRFPVKRKSAAIPDDTRLEEDFVTGFIDLVFRRDGRYFLVDWKTNQLESYEAACLADAMDASDYYRQYRLYLQALARWLALRHSPGGDIGQAFGGVYYLFVRGMTGQPGSPGVFFHQPGAADLQLDGALTGNLGRAC